MSATLAPFGLVPIYHPSGQVRSRAFQNGIDPTVTQNFFKGTPVQLATTGFLVPVTDADWDAAADDFIGVFQGIEYTDIDGRRRVSNRWIGPTSVATDSQIVVWVWTDPEIVFEGQANGSLAQTSLGDQLNFVTPTAGNSTTGLSTMALLSTPVGAGVQGYVRVVDLSLRPDNAWGDAFTVVQVKIATHEFVSDRVAI